MAKVKETKIDAFKPQGRNANRHSQRGLGSLESSMRKHGYVAPMTAAADGEIIDGSARLETVANVFDDDVLVVEHDGTKPIVMVRTDIPSANSPEAREISIAANRIAELNLTWDAEVLLADLQSGVDLSGMFNQDEIDALLDSLVDKEPVQDAGAQVDKAQALLEKWKVKPGDMFALGSHRLICGDSTDKATIAKLMQGEKADLYITDPPYAVAYADKNAYLNAVGKGNSIQTPIENDHLDIDEAKKIWLAAFKNAHEFTSNQASFYLTMPQGGDQMMMMMMMCEAEWIPRHELIWVKNNHVLGRADYAYKHEPILYGWKRKGTHKYYGGFQTSIFEIDKPQKSDLHPTTKPVELFSKLIENNTQANDIVLDTFAGSGTTCLACEQLNRQARMIELDAGYCAVILQRFKDSTGIEPVLIS